MIAFLFCLCLAIVGVVGELTDGDFAKIGSIVTSLLTTELKAFENKINAKFDTLETKFDTLETKFDTLETKFDTLETKFDTLETKFGTLNTTVGAQISDLKTFFTTAFSDSHFFNRNRVEKLQEVSANFVHCSNSDGSPKYSATSHRLAYKGKTVTVFTPHSDCLNSDAFSPTNNGAYILDDTFDLGIDIRCSPSSSTSSALDISSIFLPSLGDEIIAFGFGVTAFVWQGLVAAFLSTNVDCSSNATHWNSTSTRVCSGEIVAQGHQHHGMSGAAVLNGCGYVGMAHAVNKKTNASEANFAYIIPASAIVRLIEQNLDKLPTLEKCGKRSFVPPIATLANCATKTPLQIIINAIP
jgi:hypothetical protein